MKNYDVFHSNINDFEKSKKEFITNYKINEGNIIIFYANKQKKIIEYTKENEAHIIELMEQQIRNAVHNKFKENTEYTINTHKDIGDTCMFWGMYLVGSLAIFSLLVPSYTLEFFGYGMIGFIPMVLGSVYNYSKAKSWSMDLEDFEKNIYFLQNKKDINSKLLSKTINLKNGALSEIKYKKEISDLEENPMLNVNNIADFSLADLKKIKENIERIKNDDKCQDLLDIGPKTLKLNNFPKNK